LHILPLENMGNPARSGRGKFAFGRNLSKCLSEKLGGRFLRSAIRLELGGGRESDERKRLPTR